MAENTQKRSILDPIRSPACLLGASGGLVARNAAWDRDGSGLQDGVPACLAGLAGVAPAAVAAAFQAALAGTPASLLVGDLGHLMLMPAPIVEADDGARVLVVLAPLAPGEAVAPARTARAPDQSTFGGDMLLARSMVHDLNNVFGGIMGNAELAIHLMESGDSAEECLTWIRAMSEHGVTLNRQLDCFAKPGPARVEDVDLVAVLQRAIAAEAPAVSGVTLQATPGLPTMRGDADQLQIAFRHLLRNAAEAADTPVRVQVRLRDPDQTPRHGAGPHLVVQIHDGGPGIPNGLEERAFESGFSLHAGARGIGLAVVRTIIEGHRGQVEMERRPDGHTTRITLPVAGRDMASRATTRYPMQVLILDTREINRFAFSRLFAMLGCPVQPVTSRQEIMRLLALPVVPPATRRLLLLDERWLSKTDRDSFLAELRRDHPRDAVVITRDHRSDISSITDKPEGVDLVVSKPLSLPELRGILRHLCEPPGSDAAT